ncbi:SLAM family member 5-like [Carassius auratus]|uniref:SLAM family member 5-like n=1 Tax=Carassius auratus TaxID=7957 RepID=A0A6P6JQ56_CARAU|nr:SLAM family member 5-like [Carassius auratus]
MFATMAVDHLFASFILLLISNTGFSAEISVLVQTGDSVQLDIQTQQLPEFDILFWMNDKSENIVRYSDSKGVTPHESYKDRVVFNDKTFSLTLKNMQKTDSGLYTARIIGLINKDLVLYRISVIDAVEAPVLTVNSNWSSSDSCTVNFTCRAHELMINSSYQNNRCSPQEVTSQINALILDCSEEHIFCNHSNPVSWKQDRRNITQLCGGFSAEISVFVQTGASVQLDIQTQEKPEFDILAWMNNKSESIVRYNSDSKGVKSLDFYKDRVVFNDVTFSLTLKNMQKTDSGLYTARTIGSINKDLVLYRISVIDAVKAPVLTVNSNWSTSDSCTVNFTCRAHELMINSSYQNNRCSPQEVTSQINALILDCSEEHIFCNHSNPVSWKQDRRNITQLCGDEISKSDSSRLVIAVGTVAGCILLCVSAALCFKYKKGAQEEVEGNTVYAQVEAQEMQKLSSDCNPYDIPDRVQAETQGKTGDKQPSTTYCTVGQHQKTPTQSETDHTIYSAVCKQQNKKPPVISTSDT